jgi:hypothetical protein
MVSERMVADSAVDEHELVEVARGTHLQNLEVDEKTHAIICPSPWMVRCARIASA